MQHYIIVKRQIKRNSTWNLVQTDVCMFSLVHERSTVTWSLMGLGIIWISYRFEMERFQQLLREMPPWTALICVAHYFCDISWTMNSRRNHQLQQVSTFHCQGCFSYLWVAAPSPSHMHWYHARLYNGLIFLLCRSAANDIQELSPLMGFLGLQFI